MQYASTAPGMLLCTQTFLQNELLRDSQFWNGDNNIFSNIELEGKFKPQVKLTLGPLNEILGCFPHSVYGDGRHRIIIKNTLSELMNLQDFFCF